MGFIFTIIGFMVVLDILWWIVSARLANHGIARAVISVFIIAMMLGLIAIIAARMSRGDWDRLIPKFAVSAIFIWHFIGLGLLALIGMALIPILFGHKILSRKALAKTEHSADSSGWSRREFLRFSAAMLPPELSSTDNGETGGRHL